MSEPAAWAAAGAGLCVAGAWAVAARRGRDPLGPQPSGGLADTSAAVAVAICAWIVAPAVLTLLPKDVRLPGHGGATGAAIVHSVIAFALLRFVRRGAPPPTLSAPRVPAAGILAGLATFGIVAIVGLGVESLYALSGHAVPVQDVVSAAKAMSGLDRAAVVVSAVVLAPFAEEVFWRGALLPALAHRMSPGRAVLLQAAGFGAIHVVGAPPASWPLALPLAVVGALAGWLYVRTSSLGTVVLLHATFNALHLAFM